MLTDDDERTLEVLEAIQWPDPMDDISFEQIWKVARRDLLMVAHARPDVRWWILTDKGRAELARLRKLKEVSGDVAG